MADPVHLTPLTPLSFLGRSSAVFPDKTAIIHGGPPTQLSRDGAIGHPACPCPQSQSGSNRVTGSPISAPTSPSSWWPISGCLWRGRCWWRSTPGSPPRRSDTSSITRARRLLVVDSELTPLIEPIRDDLEGIEEIVTVDDTGVGSALAGDRTSPSSSPGAATSRSTGPSTTRTAPSRSTTPAGPREGPRVSCTPTGGPISMHSPR